MEMSGEQRIPAPRSVVWEALNDPEVLKASIPGCESLERNEAGDGFDAKVRAKVGPVNARFGGTVVLSDINPPESYTISGEGKGGSAGFARGSAKVQLTEDGSATLLSYAVEARVGGKLAQLGSRLIDGTARKMADDFFSRFSEIVQERTGVGVTAEAPAVEAPSQPAPAVAPDSVTDAAAPAAAPSSRPAAEPARAQSTAVQTARRGVSPLIWVGVLIAVVVILLALIL